MEKKINISAIVGKNGSGKSSLVELFFAFTFFLSKNELNFNDADSIENDKDLDQYSKDRYKIEMKNFEKLNVEIVYEYRENIFKISLDEQIFTSIAFYENKKSGFYEKLKTDKKLKTDEKSKTELKWILNKTYFYTIALNYSLYGLNTNEAGMYLKPLFHKNDGYQTPLVLNPMRTEGKIDINREKSLTKSRLLYNLFFNDDFRDLSNGKVADTIVFKQKHLHVENDSTFMYVKKINDRRTNLDNKIFDLILEIFYNNEYKYQKSELNEIVKKYIVSKIKKNVSKYSFLFPNADFFFVHEPFLDINGKKENPKYRIESKDFDKDKITETLNLIIGNISHITFKLRQALIFLRFNNYLNYEDISSGKKFNIRSLTDKILIMKREYESSIFNTNELKEIKDFFGKNNIDKFSKLSNFLPPAFLITDINFENNQGSFEELSSGEKQYIFTLSTIMYHILNLTSIHNQEIEIDDDIKFINYNNINIIFDEIELYFHPEMQRSFIFDLLKMISNIGTDRALNFIFITHSPFILSDIPKQNVLFLGHENTKGFKNENTFGANVHEMLTDGFFMESTKGDFAIDQINKFLDFYNDKIKLNEKPENIENDLIFYTKLINLIGEDYIRNILRNHLDDLNKRFNIPKTLSINELKEKRIKLKIDLEEIDKQINNEENKI